MHFLAALAECPAKISSYFLHAPYIGLQLYSFTVLLFSCGIWIFWWCVSWYLIFVPGLIYKISSPCFPSAEYVVMSSKKNLKCSPYIELQFYCLVGKSGYPVGVCPHLSGVCLHLLQDTQGW